MAVSAAAYSVGVVGLSSGGRGTQASVSLAAIVALIGVS